MVFFTMTKSLSIFLKDLRVARKLTLLQVERISGVSNSYLSQVENSRRGIPSPNILRKLAPVYGVEYRSLLIAAGYLDGDVEMSQDSALIVQEILVTVKRTPNGFANPVMTMGAILPMERAGVKYLKDVKK